MVGIPGFVRPIGSTIVRVAASMQGLSRYLDKRGLTGFGQVQPLHLTNFLHEQEQAGLATGSLEKFCAAIELMYRFRSEHDDCLSFQPWPQESIAEVIGATGEKNGARVAKTALIPKNVLACLYEFAENILQNADAILDERDSGQRSSVNDDPALAQIRNACFFLMGVLTGMRSDELAGIEVNAGRSQVLDGTTFHWVRSIEHKTKKGAVEYLMPEVGIRILQIMERWSAPVRAKLQLRIADLERQSSGKQNSELLKKLATARADVKRLFLTTARGLSLIHI